MSAPDLTSRTCSDCISDALPLNETHTVGGLTENDFVMAAKIDGFAPA
ncbi:MAG: 4a-hydroxytetrahydrobiopterin dehydratase [Pseudonocardiales bacterium]|jgi:hypothetical protein|nr:4a-hydroxytetrahydrobiopterin dehydratase [Pseudonocardiales bacterium]